MCPYVILRTDPSFVSETAESNHEIRDSRRRPHIRISFSGSEFSKKKCPFREFPSRNLEGKGEKTVMDAKSLRIR